MFIVTTATKKVASMQKRIRALPGGTSASKTISILMYLIHLSQSDEEPKLTSVVSESVPHLKRGAIRDFKNILQAQNYWKAANWNATDSIYTFETGSQIEFFSSDNGDKLRGARRDRLFINEANNVTWDAFEQLEVRTREIVYLDWNPTNEFWYYTDLKPERDDIEECTLTYKDNEALEEEIVKSIEQRKNRKGWWSVYGEGKLGEVEGKIYKGWAIIDEIPHEAKLVRRGLDFGYSNDPSAIVDVYQYNGGFILDEILYKKGMSNKQLADTILATEKDVLVVADAAEPKSIDEISSYGVPITPCSKGKGSVLQGIQWVQDQQISVTKRSINLIKEYRNYLWCTDREGKIINKPEHEWSHCFVYGTPVVTLNGLKPIGQVEKSDKVLTRKGYRKVVKKYYNGIKAVRPYRLQFGTLDVELTCTPCHKVFTKKGWKKISKLELGDEVILASLLTGAHTRSGKGKSIFSASTEKECTSQFGNTTTESQKKGIIYTTKTATGGIIESKILKRLRLPGTFLSTLKLGIKKTNGLLKGILQKPMKKQSCGIKAKKVENGTANTEKELGKTENTERLNVNNAEKSTKQGTLEYQNFVMQTARLKRFEQGEERSEKVYDIHVEGCHEYFANGLLVHNSMDSLRYALVTLKTNNGIEEYKKEHNRYLKNTILSELRGMPVKIEDEMEEYTQAHQDYLNSIAK